MIQKTNLKHFRRNDVIIHISIFHIQNAKVFSTNSAELNISYESITGLKLAS